MKVKHNTRVQNDVHNENYFNNTTHDCTHIYLSQKENGVKWTKRNNPNQKCGNQHHEQNSGEKQKGKTANKIINLRHSLHTSTHNNYP